MDPVDVVHDEGGGGADELLLGLANGPMDGLKIVLHHGLGGVPLQLPRALYLDADLVGGLKYLTQVVQGRLGIVVTLPQLVDLGLKAVQGRHGDLQVATVDGHAHGLGHEGLLLVNDETHIAGFLKEVIGLVEAPVDVDLGHLGELRDQLVHEVEGEGVGLVDQCLLGLVDKFLEGASVHADTLGPGDPLLAFAQLPDYVLVELLVLLSLLP